MEKRDICIFSRIKLNTAALRNMVDTNTRMLAKFMFELPFPYLFYISLSQFLKLLKAAACVMGSINYLIGVCLLRNSDNKFLSCDC